jgi:hypothetical protein
MPADGVLGFSSAFKGLNRVEPCYNDIGLYDTSSITSALLWHELIPHFCITLFSPAITTRSIHGVITEFDRISQKKCHLAKSKYSDNFTGE